MILLSAIPGPVVTHVTPEIPSPVPRMEQVAFLLNLVIILTMSIIFLTWEKKINKKLIVLDMVITAIMTIIVLLKSNTELSETLYHANAIFITLLLICYLILIIVFKNEGNVSKKKKIIGISIAIHIMLQTIFFILNRHVTTLEEAREWEKVEGIIPTITYVCWLIETGLMVTNFIVATRKNKQIN